MLILNAVVLPKNLATNLTFEKMAGDLMTIAGVKKLDLHYDKYKVTIELQ